MLQPLRQTPRTQERSKDYLVPASTKGWVQNQAIAQMDPQSAYQLDNWFPEATGLRLRRGNQPFAACGVSMIETIAAYTVGAGSASNKLFAFSNGKIYDITAGGASSVVYSGLNSNHWTCINFANAAGNWLICVSGHDAPIAYGPGGWTTLAITGVTASTLTYVWEYQGTLFFCQGPNFWYLAPGAIQGAASQFPLGALLNKGGNLQVGGQWTFTTAYSILNLCAFISSEGEVLIYQGNNPSSASTWSLTAHFYIGRPIADRCLLNINSDLIVLCEDGLMPLSKALQYDRPEAAREALTWNIQNAFNDAYLAAPPIYIGATGWQTGWEIVAFPLQHMAVINASTPAVGVFTQFVENMTTGAWCRYQNVPAACRCVQQDTIYWGDAWGGVWIGESGSGDGASGNANFPLSPISAIWVSAFNDLEAPGRSKSALAVKIVFQSVAGISPQTGVCVDYYTPVPPATPTTLAPQTALWDVAIWDQAVWGAPLGTIGPWVAALGDGYQFATTCAINVQGYDPTRNMDVQIVASYVLYEPGALLA